MVYVTSDLHGYPLDKFIALLKKANFSSDDYCFILGDVIDRGEHGAEILKWLLTQSNVQLIIGNHEAMMLACRFLFSEITEDTVSSSLTGENMSTLSLWLRNGGQKTVDGLKRFDREALRDIIEYLESAPLYETVSAGGRDFLLTHSGLGNFKPERKISDYYPDELIWNRPSPDDRYRDDIITVFGHTPTHFLSPEHRGRMLVTDTWIDIDTGCACGLSPMLLRLDDLTPFYE